MASEVLEPYQRLCFITSRPIQELIFLFQTFSVLSPYKGLKRRVQPQFLIFQFFGYCYYLLFW